MIKIGAHLIPVVWFDFGSEVLKVNYCGSNMKEQWPKVWSHLIDGVGLD